MVFSNLKPENNALLSAIYNLIHYDEDNLIYKVIKNMKKPGVLMDTRLVYFTCITAFEDKKDLPQDHRHGCCRGSAGDDRTRRVLRL